MTQATQVLYPDKPARHFLNGVRVSAAVYRAAVDSGIASGRYSCSTTRAVQLPGGTFKRFNYCVV